MKNSKQNKYLQRQLSSFSESIKSIIPSKSFSQLSLSSSPPHRHDSHLDLSSLYDLCMLLKDMILQLGARAIIHDFLLMLYVECSEKSPDLSYVINWIKSRFWLRILEEDAQLLIEYMKLFHPLTTEGLSEYDGFLYMLDQDPLLLYVATDPMTQRTRAGGEGSSKAAAVAGALNSPLISKEKWCEKMSIFVKERATELFWDRAKLNHERKVIGRKLRSFTRLLSLPSSKVTPVPTTEMIDQPIGNGENEDGAGGDGAEVNKKFIRQKSMFETNAIWMERARADSHSSISQARHSIRGQHSFQSLDFMKLHSPHPLSHSGLGETKAEHHFATEADGDKTSSFHGCRTPIRLPSLSHSHSSSQVTEEKSIEANAVVATGAPVSERRKSSLLLEDA
jgi:hypothetical protein